MTGSIKTDNTQVILNLQAKILSLQAAIKVKDEALEMAKLRFSYLSTQIEECNGVKPLVAINEIDEALSLPTDNLMLEEV
jgi:hypothetical protein